MSILEEIGSTASGADTPSPSSTVAPRGRLRHSTRITGRFKERMREAEDEEDDEKDDRDESPPAKRSSQRGRTASRPPVEEEEEDGGEEDEAAENASRYAFRERRQSHPPNRFDQKMYDEVFEPMREYREAQTARKKRARRRRRRSGSSRRPSKRRRQSVDEEEGEEEGDDDDEQQEEDEEDFATDTSDVEELSRRIAAQERAEAEAAKATADASRSTRQTRYSLRTKESDTSVNESFSPVRKQTDSSGSRRTGRSRRVEREEEVAVDTADENGTAEHDDEEDEDEDVEEEEENGKRYYLRERNLPERRPRSRQSEAYDRRERSARSERARRRADDRELPINDNEPRYSLRDRSKVQRNGETSPTKDPTQRAFADYSKRIANRASSQRRSRPYNALPSSSRRPERSNSRRKHRRRRLSGSSSSDSSDSDMFKYYDSDEGGMRTSGGNKHRGAPVDRKRADITPVEVDRSITWDSVGGLEKHIEALKEMVMLPLLYPEFYEKYNITPPSGVLFYGPPGTGKTLLARALANSCSVDDDGLATVISPDGTEVEARKPRHVTFYMRKGADCLSKWVGEAERQLRLLFEEAKRNQPSIIFFDEIDGLAPVRSAKQDQIHASIVSTLLALMDGMDSRGRVVVIGATNRLDSIDPALRRPGRFDRELGFKLPNVQERKKMLHIHTKKWNPPLSAAFTQEIAEKTVGYCGADVKALCAEAALCSLRRVYPQVYGSQDKLLIQLDKVVVSRGDFTKAMKKITPASNRTVSSFAAPLPRGVKTLLESSLTSVLKKIRHHFPLFPLDIQEIDGMLKSDGSANDMSDGDESHDHDIYAIMNRDDCDVCHGDEGELLCCDACPAALHPGCLPGDHERPRDDEGHDWFCPDCCISSRVEELAEAKRRRESQRRARQMYALPQHVGFPRVLITGASGMGQQYVGAGLLHAMEGFTHFSLDYPSLVADSNTHHAEEALIHRLNEAQKCLPCVIFLPQADLWWENVSESMRTALKMMLMNMQIKANLPVLFLAFTSSTVYNGLPRGLTDLFSYDKTSRRTSVLWEIRETSRPKRREQFAQAFSAFGAEPLPRRKRRRDEPLEVLPLAPVMKQKREPTLEELVKIKERDMHFLRELRIFLGQVLDYCATHKPYTPFLFPVDPEAVPDYYLIIKNPMDLNSMREKLNDGDYTCFEQFLDDIQLIVQNANLFNPKRSATRHIAHSAGTMKDNILSFAHRFRKHQGYDLFAKCREITKRLHTNPLFYSDVNIPAHEVPKAARAMQKALAAAPVRTSARLKGEKAPESVELPSRKHERRSLDSSVEKDDDMKMNSVDEDPDDEANQWFSVREESTTAAGIEVAAESESTDRDEPPGSAEDTQTHETFNVGDHVFVQSRMYPGMNKEGGAGKIVLSNDDDTYNVKYVLGGSEKNVHARYISHLTEDAVKESVKNQRPAESVAPSRTAEVEEVKSEEDLKLEFFDKLVWPMLVDEGWTRNEVMDEEAGVLVTFSPDQSNSQELKGVAAAMEYIKSDTTLAIKCFGKRFAEEPLTEAVFDESTTQTDELLSSAGRADAAGECANQENADGALTESSTTVAPAPTDATMKENDSEEEQPPLIYDEGRMIRALDALVEKTAGWTIEELRDELLLLNKLAYPFRYNHDRTKLMEQVEVHIEKIRPKASG
ncbi:hypothetical protein Poli38472_007083 [Pythium oligandrum]|uniref:Bromo domain-containing protein n=1 Tax=Pythium oligandrum TaxID=41045 RepID=A0A8K1C9K5_PYTOL|nr:hypothetical protein Poli38472_007083 [Pythium oligandrum]|eukprot:TMW58938.1 hypothetical protein Poli38472_007083 [Pythium oligandrum]